jgi:small membrane protein
LAPIIIISLVLIAVYAGTKRLSGLQVLGVAAFVLLGVLLVVFPAISTRIANLLGVGRGTDLIFYLAVLAGIFVASNFYFRFKRQEEALIALARQSAIANAQEPQGERPLNLGPQRDGPVEEVKDDLHRVEP